MRPLQAVGEGLLGREPSRSERSGSTGPVTVPQLCPMRPQEELGKRMGSFFVLTAAREPAATPTQAHRMEGVFLWTLEVATFGHSSISMPDFSFRLKHDPELCPFIWCLLAARCWGNVYVLVLRKGPEVEPVGTPPRGHRNSAPRAPQMVSLQTAKSALFCRRKEGKNACVHRPTTRMSTNRALGRRRVPPSSHCWSSCSGHRFLLVDFRTYK